VLVATESPSRPRPAPRRAGRPGAATTSRLLLLAALSGGTAACSGAPRIAIGGQEARLSPLVVGACSIFMTIENAGNGDDSLVGAAVDIPGAVAELHGVSDGRMVRKDRVRIPAKGAVELKPGGLHVMVFRLPRDAGAGYQFTLRLAFERAGEKVTSVRIAG
jgi:copper(I)-binding protein